MSFKDKKMNNQISLNLLLGTIQDGSDAEDLVIPYDDLFQLEKDLYRSRFLPSEPEQQLASESGEVPEEYLQQMADAFYSQKASFRPTPEYLKKIIRLQLSNEEKKAAQEQLAEGLITKIQIKIKNGMRLLSDFSSEVFLLEKADEALAVRSNIAAQVTAPNYDVLNFYSQANSGLGSEKILYQIVKDGIDTVMLTIRLQNFRTIPKMLYLKRNNRLIQSFALKEDFAYFQQLQPDLYTIELKGTNGEIIKQISLQLITE